MTAFRIPIAVAALLAVLIPASPASAQSPPSDLAAAAAADARFACDLYRRLAAADPDGNLFLSPHSISVALAMTYAGARGETEREMRRVLHFELGQERLHGALGALEADLSARLATERVTLSSANALWPQKDVTLRQEFLDLVASRYGAPVTPLDYREPERARRVINHWVEEQTRERIRDLIRPGDLTPLSTLVLTNAVHFLGDWRWRFDPAETRPATFTLADGRTREVPLMFQRGELRHLATEDLEVLELPYADADLAMLVLLPAAGTGLSDLEKRLTPEAIDGWLGELRRSPIRVFLPRFELAWGTEDLVPALRELGMRVPFDHARADFTGIVPGGGIWIDHVLHKAFVKVTEEGTEAAAATAVTMKREAPPPVFRADRPFLFLIRDGATGAILFTGRLADPGDGKSGSGGRADPE